MSKRKPLTEKEITEIAYSLGWQEDEYVGALMILADHKAAQGCPYRSASAVKMQLNKFRDDKDGWIDAVERAVISGWKAAYPDERRKPRQQPQEQEGESDVEIEIALFGTPLAAGETVLQRTNGIGGSAEEDVC